MDVDELVAQYPRWSLPLRRDPPSSSSSLALDFVALDRFPTETRSYGRGSSVMALLRPAKFASFQARRTIRTIGICSALIRSRAFGDSSFEHRPKRFRETPLTNASKRRLETLSLTPQLCDEILALVK
jgi:hypothetical protein